MENQQRLADMPFENAEIIFRNFSGKADQYNPNGARGFAVLIHDKKLADDMAKDGWNIKVTYERDENGNRTDKIRDWFLPVSVRFDKIPPKIFLITSKGKTLLGENEVGMLDSCSILNCDVVVNPSRYNVKATGRSGIKAYVKSMYVTIQEDPMMQKYGY
jgi:hypothetical protein